MRVDLRALLGSSEINTCEFHYLRSSGNAGDAGEPRRDRNAATTGCFHIRSCRMPAEGGIFRLTRRRSPQLNIRFGLGLVTEPERTDAACGHRSEAEGVRRVKTACLHQKLSSLLAFLRRFCALLLNLS